MERILAFGAHPDDVEFQCAGTLALLAELGHEVHIAVMAGGDMGSPDLPPLRIREIRLKENAKSAEVIGATFHYAGGQDVEIEYSHHYRNLAIKVMRAVNPTIVFTNPPMDYMIDHEETSRLVRNATFVAPIPNYDCGEPTSPTTQVPYLYYWNAMGGRDIFGRTLPYTCGIDISSKLDTKESMLSCHASQREWLRHHHHMDKYLETMRLGATAQGEIVGRPAAELFVQHLGSEYPNDNILSTLLGDLCISLR
jgi:LmbE family N-acetylglucosaminyl deacetylase